MKLNVLSPRRRRGDKTKNNSHCRLCRSRGGMELIMSKTCLLFPGQGSIKLEGGLQNVSQLITSAITLSDALAFMKDNPGEYTAVGHSLGEFAMLTAAGVFTPEELFNILDVRSRAMAKACELDPGAMYAIIGAPPEKVEKTCWDYVNNAGANVWAVNFNSDVQTVISGEITAVTAAAEKFVEEGFKTVRLDVAGAFHTPLMQPAAEELRDYLKDKTFGEPTFPIYSTYTGKRFGMDDIKSLSEYFYIQMISPVVFTGTIRAIRADYPGINFHEYGKTLTGMLKRIK
jgi:[acyl-carrier-protein] S-malonyltransferase